MVESAFAQFEIDAREVVEGFYIESLEGLYFTVKGLEHPADHRIAVLRYVPDPEAGDRIKDGISYRRLYRFEEQERWIREMCPQYRVYDPVFQSTMQSVPESMVRRIYHPCLYLQKLLQRPEKGALEEDAIAFLSILRKKAEVPLSTLGITGSILIGLHNERSDIDVAVYGERNCRRVHRALKSLLDEGGEEDLTRLDAGGIEALYDQRSIDTKMDFREFADLESRKANQGRFRERTWFIRFIKETDETEDRYGKCSYKALGRARIHASVADDEEAIFTPCLYRLSGVRNVEGLQQPEPCEIVSFRGRFCEQARSGDRVMATGTLERLQYSRSDIRHRLLLGNSAEDTMIVVK